MKIKKIKILKKKVSISLDNGEKLEVDKNVYPNFYLYEGKEITNKEIKKIEEFASSASLLQYAMKIREKSLYTEYHMREKLYDRGGNKTDVDYVIKFMKKHDLIDDEAFIEEFHEYYNSLNYGENKIRTKLKEKGIFEDRIEKIKFPVSEERRKAKNILPKLEKKYDKYNYAQKKQHIYQAYLSSGFNRDIASEMVSSLKESNPREEHNKLESDFNKAYTRFKGKYDKKQIKSKLINYLASKGYKISDIIKMMERKGL